MLPQNPDLSEKILSLLEQIPSGRVTTYGDVARAIGDVRASRYVGELMLSHRHHASCRCYRVVRSDGSMGKFISGRPEEKKDRLVRESIVFRKDVVDLKTSHWNSFQCEQPLARLADSQRSMAATAETSIAVSMPDRIGGVDISYVPRRGQGVATYVEVQGEDLERIHEESVQAKIDFPYISGYLAFRELPLLIRLLQQVRAARPLPEVILVDGSGILHPRRAGVATMLGVELNCTTIGVTKKRLAGTVNTSDVSREGAEEIIFEGEVCGYALLPRTSSAKRLYVSPGHRIDAPSALNIVGSCLRQRRLPEPIYWADRLSRAAARTTAAQSMANEPDATDRT